LHFAWDDDSATVTVTIPPPDADFDSDGDIDGRDVLAWQRGDGIQAPNATKADGDADNDLDVGGDDLGILGREGVYAANIWGGGSYIDGAFDMYLNYDGASGSFGDTSIDADTSNIANSAVYASVDSSDPNRMIVVAINRTGSAQTTDIAVTHDRVFDHAEVYRLTSSSTNIVHGANIELNLPNAFQYTMPAYSVTTLVPISDGIVGDFNRDGTVNAADYTV
jgi:mannan endo-1,4-beta-mannosidase